MEKAKETLEKLKAGLDGITPESYEDRIYTEGKIAGLESAITLLEEATKVEVKNGTN